jgi:hypothetical protein
MKKLCLLPLDIYYSALLRNAEESEQEMVCL